MIELLLEAERALGLGLVDQAERLYRQAADADPRNSIAVVGLARVALERGDEAGAWREARRALEIDPENVAARRLTGKLEEVWAQRGESPPIQGNAPGPASPPAAPPGPASPPAPTSAATAAGDPAQPPAPPRERSALDRLLRRYRP